MKCPICNQPLNYFDIEYLFVYRSRCINCNKLFIYDKKNVRIKGVFIKVLTLKYYSYLKKYYLDKDYYFDYEKHNKNTYVIDEFNFQNIKSKKIIILFKRENKLMIKETINKISNDQKVSKITFKEVINFTKRTQKDY